MDRTLVARYFAPEDVFINTHFLDPNIEHVRVNAGARSNLYIQLFYVTGGREHLRWEGHVPFDGAVYYFGAPRDDAVERMVVVYDAATHSAEVHCKYTAATGRYVFGEVHLPLQASPFDPPRAFRWSAHRHLKLVYALRALDLTEEEE